MGMWSDVQTGRVEEKVLAWGLAARRENWSEGKEVSQGSVRLILVGILSR